MSGIGGIVSLEGAPVSEAPLRRMAGCLAFRGPDGASLHLDGSAGLVHTLLRTGGGPGDALPQPATLDGRVWIAAEARVDGREDLVRHLRDAGRTVSIDAPDAHLILHAHAAWGDACVARLIGDFAFAVWDAPRRRLFCARDHFGLKPFYHAVVGGDFVFSNTLDCLRDWPGVSSELDEAWLADFFVHGHSQEPHRTAWAGIRALPPAHTLVVENGEIRVERYWTLPLDPDPLPYRHPAEYVEHFLDVMGRAVTDRLPRDGGTAVFLSGGRDSTSMAALAREAIDRGARRTEMRGYTAYYERLMPDEERRFAEMAGRALGIPIDFLAVDGYEAFERWEAPALHRPEPTDSVLMAIEVDQLSAAAAHARVLLTGHGADPALRETRSHLTRLTLEGRIFRAIAEAAEYVRRHHRLPRPGVRTYFRDRSGGTRWWARVPEWIDPGFARRTEIADRVDAWNARESPRHPLRPEAHEQLSGALWPEVFRVYDPGATKIPIEGRHPYFDVRVITFLLSIPPVQWYNDKGLLRIGMRGRLPPALLRRPKTPLSGDPLLARYERGGAGWLGGRTLDASVARFVDPARVPRAAGGGADRDSAALWEDLRPLALSIWLGRPGFGPWHTVDVPPFP